MKKLGPTLCVIAFIASIWFLANTIRAADKEFIGPPDAQAYMKATRAGQKVVQVIDKILTDKSVTLGECNEASEAICHLRRNLNDQYMDRRTSTEHIQELTGEREWIKIAKKAGSGKDEGWLTAAHSVLQIGTMKARWSHFLALVKETGSIPKMNGIEISDALVDLISVRDFLIKVKEGEDDMSLRSISGACYALTGEYQLIIKNIPDMPYLSSSIKKANEIWQVRSKEAQRKAAGLSPNS